jgi:hypothetical protein
LIGEGALRIAAVHRNRIGDIIFVAVVVNHH